MKAILIIAALAIVAWAASRAKQQNEANKNIYKSAYRHKYAKK